MVSKECLKNSKKILNLHKNVNEAVENILDVLKNLIKRIEILESNLNTISSVPKPSHKGGEEKPCKG